MAKIKLGMSCGKFCETCGEPVSLDAQGRFTCFSCGRFVGAIDVSQIKTRHRKEVANQLPLIKQGWGLPG